MPHDVPLWHVDDQQERLHELLGIPPDVKEKPLRRDVRSLGQLLGNVLKEQEGDTVFAMVETLRKLSISGRTATSGFDQPYQIIRNITVDDAGKLAKAFAIYFELTNLAETNHRKRRRRAAQLSPNLQPQPGTFKGTLIRARDAGVEFDDMLAALRRIHVVPVFTAHPTEVARRTVIWKRQRISQLLEELDVLPLMDASAVSVQLEITEGITALWQTDEVRRASPTISDEIQMGLDYSPILFETIPEVYAVVTDAIEAVYERDLETHTLPCLVEFGSWIGGDQDGNPSVTTESAEYALARARETILEYYVHSMRELHRRLSSSRKRIGVSRELESRVESYKACLQLRTTDRVDEPYRQFLSCILFRLRQTALDKPGPDAYKDAAEFVEDLHVMRASLMAHKGRRLAELLVDPAIENARTFGFHLHGLDLRQHSRVHAEAFEALRTGAAASMDSARVVGSAAQHQASSAKVRPIGCEVLRRERHVLYVGYPVAGLDGGTGGSGSYEIDARTVV
jgi:phosphoenolpyruvate carboxylase